MKKIIASAVVWAGLWAGGMLLFELKTWEAKPMDAWFLTLPLFLAAALAVWGIIAAKGGVGTLAGMMLGIFLGVGALLGSFLLGAAFAECLRGDGDMAGRIAWVLAGGIMGGLAGALSEMGRQGMRQENWTVSKSPPEK